jgi:protocatechuate 3,4-dioxygenase beta subunit
VRDRAPDAAPVGTISGRVVDAQSGAPLRRVMVRVSGANLREGRIVTTDADGRYQITGLPGGSFNLSASRPGYVDLSYGQRQPLEPGKPLTLRAQQTLEHIDFALLRGAVVTGRVLDEFGEPLPDVSVTPMRLMYSGTGRRPAPVGSGRPGTTNDIGEFRVYGLMPGDFIITATHRANGFGSAPDDRGGYAPTYYPGTPNIAEAQAIRVGSGQTLTDVTIMLSPTRLAQISGMAFDANGQILKQGSVNVMSNQNGYFSSGGFAQIRPDGTFTINGVPPGEYRIMANTNTPALVTGPTPAPPDQPAAVVAVNGTDITNLRLDVPRRLSLRGRVIIDSGVTEQPRLQGMRVTAMATGPSLITGATREATIDGDSTFEIQSLPGSMMIRANGLPAGWAVKQIRYGVLDVSDGIVVADDMNDLEIELTNRISEISGTVSNGRNETAPDTFAIVFPVEVETRRRITFNNGAMARTDDQGKFRFRTLRPGDYYIVVVNHLEQGQWLDAEFQESVIPDATRVTVGEGETKTINLKVSDDR